MAASYAAMVPPLDMVMAFPDELCGVGWIPHERLSWNLDS